MAPGPRVPSAALRRGAMPSARCAHAHGVRVQERRSAGAQELRSALRRSDTTRRAPLRRRAQCSISPNLGPGEMRLASGSTEQLSHPDHLFMPVERRAASPLRTEIPWDARRGRLTGPAISGQRSAIAPEANARENRRRPLQRRTHASDSPWPPWPAAALVHRDSTYIFYINSMRFFPQFLPTGFPVHHPMAGCPPTPQPPRGGLRARC